MAQTMDDQRCQDYLQRYLGTLKETIERCETAIHRQTSINPIRHLSLDDIDRLLKEYVHQQRSYLIGRYSQPTSNYDNTSSILSWTTTEFVRPHLHRLNQLRQQQGEVWFEWLTLEARIRCQHLPIMFDRLESIVDRIAYEPLNDESLLIAMKNKRYRSIQELKRTWLNLLFKHYEDQVQQYDQQYRQELRALELSLIHQQQHSSKRMQHLQEYLQDQTRCLQQTIYRRLREIQRKVHHNRRSQSSSRISVGVSPEPYLALANNPFTKNEWKYLSLGNDTHTHTH